MAPRLLIVAEQQPDGEEPYHKVTVTEEDGLQWTCATNTVALGAGLLSQRLTEPVTTGRSSKCGTRALPRHRAPAE